MVPFYWTFVVVEVKVAITTGPSTDTDTSTNYKAVHTGLSTGCKAV
jgi:hypothetical protein